MRVGEIVKGAFSGKETVQTATQEATTRLVTIAETLAALRTAGAGLQCAIIDLSLDMASRIVQKCIELEPALVDHMYAGALEAAQELQGAVVAVHPVDRGASAVDALAAKLTFTVEEDEAVGRGGCRVLLGGTEVNATLPVLLDAFRTALKRTAHVSS